MNDQVKCPHCGKVFAMNQAILHLVEKEKSKFEEERKKLREEAQKWREMQQKKFDDQNRQKEKEIEERIKEKLKEETELQIKDKSNEIGELRKQNKSLQDQLLDINRLLRQLRSEREEEKLNSEKRLIEVEEKLRQQAKEVAEKEYKFKILELEKQRQDAIKLANEYKNKFEQGSQQLQGEVVELELENILKSEFPYDEIKEVPKGVLGGDILQTVINSYGKQCGTIIWEFKRTKLWSEGWISKLNEDKRQVKADIAILVSQILPREVRNFAERNKVFICNFESVIGLASLIRNKLIDIAVLKASTVGKNEKKEILWNYLNSIEFQQRLEAINEAIDQKENLLRREKDWFRKKWALEEKTIQIFKNNLLGMHGDLGGIIGKSLPELKGLESLPTGGEKDGSKDKGELF